MIVLIRIYDTFLFILCSYGVNKAPDLEIASLLPFFFAHFYDTIVIIMIFVLMISFVLCFLHFYII